MSDENNKVVSLLRQQYASAHALLAATVQGISPEQAHWPPPGCALPLAAHNAHLVTSEDGVINRLIRGAAPLAATSWAGKTGASEEQPRGFAWAEWARRLQVDLPSMHAYAQAVFANTDSYLASLIDDDLERALDLSSLGSGQQTVGWLLKVMLRHVDNHVGEISCLKGIQGLKGYPV